MGGAVLSSFPSHSSTSLSIDSSGAVRYAIYLTGRRAGHGGFRYGVYHPIESCAERRHRYMNHGDAAWRGRRVPTTHSRRAPKKVYRTHAARFTIDLVTSSGATMPKHVLSTVMIASAANAPVNTMLRGCRIAMMAAMMNVSSPISLTRICTQGTRGGKTDQPKACTVAA